MHVPQAGSTLPPHPPPAVPPGASLGPPLGGGTVPGYGQQNAPAQLPSVAVGAGQQNASLGGGSVPGYGQQNAQSQLSSAAVGGWQQNAPLGWSPAAHSPGQGSLQGYQTLPPGQTSQAGSQFPTQPHATSSVMTPLGGTHSPMQSSTTGAQMNPSSSSQFPTQQLATAGWMQPLSGGTHPALAPQTLPPLSPTISSTAVPSSTLPGLQAAPGPQQFVAADGTLQVSIAGFYRDNNNHTVDVEQHGSSVAFTVDVEQHGSSVAKGATLSGRKLQITDPTSYPTAAEGEVLDNGDIKFIANGGLWTKQAPRAGQLRVVVIEAVGLRLKDRFGGTDPFCTCEVGIQAKIHSKKDTPVAKNTLNPTWNLEHIFKHCSIGDIIHFTVWDKQFFSTMKLGRFSLDFNHFYPNGFYGKLLLSDGVKDAKPSLMVKVSVKPQGEENWRVPGNIPSELSATPAAGTDGAPGTAPDSAASAPVGQTQPGGAPSAAAAPGQTEPAPSLGPTLPPGQSSSATMSDKATLEKLLGEPLSAMQPAPASVPYTVAHMEVPTMETVPPEKFVLQPERQKDAGRAMAKWMDYWMLRRSMPSDPQRFKAIRQQDVTQDRMFALRMKQAIDMLVPLAADERVQKVRWPEARNAAARESMSSLSLRFRFSFLDALGGLTPALCGHNTLSTKLRVEKAEALPAPIVASSPGCMPLCGTVAKGAELGRLKVSVPCEQLPPLFFRSSTSGSDRQLVLEVLAELEPQAVLLPAEHVLLPGETLRIRASGWNRYPDTVSKGATQFGGGVAFTIDLVSKSDNIALRWAPCLDGEHVIRNSLVQSAWGVPETHGGWPHHATPPAVGGRGAPVLLDFTRRAAAAGAAECWEVWVDGERQPEFDFQMRTTASDVIGAKASDNVENLEVLVIPDPRPATYASSYGRMMKTADFPPQPRKWRVDTGQVATAKPKGSAAKRNVGDLYGMGELVTIGWMCIRFDNATETARTCKGALLRLGSLHEWLLPQTDSRGLPIPPANNLNEFLQRVEGQQVGSIDYELERLQIQPIAQRLLPSDFPAWVGMPRLGGVSSDISKGRKGLLALRAADTVDCLFRDACVTFPDDMWLQELQNSIGSQRPFSPGSPGQFQHLCLKVGTHNCLRWLDEKVKNSMQQRVLPGKGVTPDDSGNTWKLALDPEERRWMFKGSEVPLEFVCDTDCAVVLELGVVFTSSPTPSTPPATHTESIGWLLLLPLVHTTEQALRQVDSVASLKSGLSSTPVVYYNMEVLQQPDPISGQTIFQRRQTGQGSQGAVRISFGIKGHGYWKWLQRKCTPIQVPEELKPKPIQPPLPAVGQDQPQTMQDKTKDLLWKRPGQSEIDAAVVSGLTPQPQPHQPPFPTTPPKPITQFPQQPTLPIQPLVYPTPSPQPAPTGMPVLPSPEMQTVVERIYLRDQGTQSDPPPLPGMEDQVIGEGRQLSKAAAAALASSTSPPGVQPYTGPAMRPMPGASAARLVQDIGDTAASRILQGLAHTKYLGGARRELRWRLEDDDPLQADEITVEFLAYRSFVGGFSDRLHFQLRFFVFPPLKTSSAALAGNVGEACILRSAVTNDRLALVYNVDGATKGAASQVHRQLVEYLSARNAEVEVWSTDSAMQVGAANIPLEPLVRQSQQVAKVEGEFPVLDPMTGETRGSVQILLACRGRTPARAGAAHPALQNSSLNVSALPEASTVIESSAVAAGSATAAVREAQGERGRVRRHKAQALMGANAGPSVVGSAVEFPDDAAKKRHRLKQFRMLRGTDPSTERFSEHTALLSAAEEVRADRKKAEVARRMDRFNTTQLTVFAPFANSTFFHIDFANPYNQQMTFIVTISEPQKPQGPPVNFATGEIGVPSAPPKSAAANFQGILEQPPEDALVLVKDPQEFQRLVADKKMPPPPRGEFAMFSALGHFQLRPGEGAFLPFRFLAFKHPSLSTVAQQASGAGMSLPEAEAQTPEVPDRIFVIEVTVFQGPPLKRVEVTVRAQPCVVDKTIRFFEVEGSPLEKALALPARPAMSGLLRGTGQNVSDVGNHSMAGFLSTSVDRSLDRFVYCTDKDVHLQWKDDDTLQLRLLAPMSPAVRKFFVLCYADSSFMRVVAAQLVEVHAMKSEHVRVCVGQSVDRTISLPPVEVMDTVVVQAFSSDPDMVFVREAASVDPRYGAKLALTVTAMKAGTRTCRLHATDPATRRRLAAFLIIVAADMPNVRMAHDITLPLNRPVRKHLKYKNETMQPLRYTVKSSDPALVAVQSPELMLPPGDTRVVELLFHAYPGTMSYNTEVYMFIASEDRAIQETRLLQLTYT